MANCLSFKLPAAELRGQVVDGQTGKPLAARIYLEDAKGKWFFVKSSAPDGSAVRYDKTNWVRKDAFEKHTTISAHPFQVDLPAGDYTMTVERGKEYFVETRKLSIGKEDAKVEVKLNRWINMAQRGWFSGETHIHRTLQDLPNVILAEDLNVAMPLTYWVTKSDLPPTTGNRNLGGEIPDKLITVDPTHVIWPRNTEYEISSFGNKRHMLGALFFLNHKSVLNQGVPPWGPLAKRARAEGAIFDMDKLDWPFSMTLPHSTGARLYELANNHMWRTHFAFTRWNSRTPGFLQPPSGGKGGGEEDWMNYTFGQFYTLLNAGFPLAPTAGTANGVHPVPVGFSRVYAYLPEGFGYEAWLENLKKGRSFITTGPMLFAKVNDQWPGAKLKFGKDGGELKVTGEVISENRITCMEIIMNGKPVKLLRGGRRTKEGAHRLSFATTLPMKTSGWICIRCFEERPAGRLRFAHTAPWLVEVPGKPLRLSPEEKEYLVNRVQTEIDRSQGIVSKEAMAEYVGALKHYQNLPTREVPTPEARLPKDDAKLKRWLDNMVAHHRFTPHEARAATGLSIEDVKQKLDHWNIIPGSAPKRAADEPLKVLPYPGGRHPRIGFLEGA
ncbi:MAG: CehA/McbA family metallohydrolase, partial [Opitutales bacterium]